MNTQSALLQMPLAGHPPVGPTPEQLMAWQLTLDSNFKACLGQECADDQTKRWARPPVAALSCLAQAGLPLPPPVSPQEEVDKQLVILDLNGTLIHREKDYRPGQPKFTSRPYLEEFLQYLFDNFKVMIWSSSKPSTIREILKCWPFQGQQSALVAVWNRTHMGIPAEFYNDKIQTYKNLDKVWGSQDIQRHHPGYDSGKRWSQANTILIDDSWLKASAQPFNLLKVPTYEGPYRDNEDLLGEIFQYLEVLRRQRDVSNFMHKRPFRNNGYP